MGWEVIPWYTLTDDFDADFGVDEWHGTNAFFRDAEDRIFRTYFCRQPRRRGDGGHLGRTSTSPRWGARRSGRTRPPATRRPRPTSGGTSHDEYGRGPVSEREWSSRVERGKAVMADPPQGRGELAPVIAHVGGVPLEELLPLTPGATAGLLLARAWLMLHLRRRRKPETYLRQDAARQAQVPGARRGGLRSVDERGGPPPLVARRSTTGRRPRPRSTCASAARCGSSCATPTRTSSTAAAARTPRSSRRPAWRSPGSGTTIQGETLIEVDFEESDWRDHRPLHPQRPLGRGGRALARRRDGAKLFDNLVRELETARG